jgi:hypothetical protein
MFPKALLQIIGHTNVEGLMSFVGEDVDEVIVVHPETRKWRRRILEVLRLRSG